MILFPAIDLKNGQCVRLKQGDMEQATVFNDDPGRPGARLRGAGFPLAPCRRSRRRLRRQADERAPPSRRSWRASPSRFSSAAASATWRRSRAGSAKGVRRVIIGTAAVRDPAFVREAAKAFPGQVAVGIDARDGFVAVEGWAETSALAADDLGRRFEDAGVAAIVYTDIARDGMLQGINWDGTIALAKALTIPVIASGGLASMADIERLVAPDAAILEGAITGRALYDGRIDAGEALARVAQAGEGKAA